MPSPGVDLSGKTAIVTGAGQGLGRAMAAALAGAGANIVLVGRTPETLADAARECEALGARALPAGCDVTERDRVDALVDQVRKELGGPHILINNAGISRPSPIGEMSDELWHTTLETNLSAAFYFAGRPGATCCPPGRERWSTSARAPGAGDAPTRRPTPRARRESPASPRPSPSNGRPSGIQVNCIAPGRFRTPPGRRAHRRSRGERALPPDGSDEALRRARGDRGIGSFPLRARERFHDQPDRPLRRRQRGPLIASGGAATPSLDPDGVALPAIDIDRISGDAIGQVRDQVENRLGDIVR